MGLLLILILGGRLFAQQPSAAPALQQEETPVFKASATWVRLDVQVGQRARLVNDLTKDDFIVYDESQPQKILYFGHETEPLDVLLLLDISGSMRRYLEQMAANAKAALQALHEGDRVAVMLFSRRTRLEEDFTTDRQRIINELHDSVHEGAGLGGGTRTNAALLSAIAYIEQNAKGKKPGEVARHAILVVTDNQSMDYLMPDEKVIQTLLSADTVCNAIVVGRIERLKPPKPGEYVNPDFNVSDVFEISSETGGEAMKTERADTTFVEMMEGIRTRYTLAYAAPASAQPGTFRRVRVELTPEALKRHPGASVRVRSGYVVK